MFQKKIFCQRGFKGSSEKQQRKRRKLAVSSINSCFIKQTNLYHFFGTISTCWNLFFSSCTAPYFKLSGKLMGLTRGNKIEYSYNILKKTFFSKMHLRKIKFSKHEKLFECPFDSNCGTIFTHIMNCLRMLAIYKQAQYLITLATYIENNMHKTNQ